jgi:hypothetical protein
MPDGGEEFQRVSMSSTVVYRFSPAVYGDIIDKLAAHRRLQPLTAQAQRDFDEATQVDQFQMPRQVRRHHRHVEVGADEMHDTGDDVEAGHQPQQDAFGLAHRRLSARPATPVGLFRCTFRLPSVAGPLCR